MSVGARVLWIVGAVLLVLIVATAWVGVRGLLAKNHLEAAIPLAGEMQDQVATGDVAGATGTFNDFADHASSAASLTGDPVWRAFEVIPVLGPNLTAVRDVAGTVNAVAGDAIAPLISVASSMDATAFQPVDGAIDLQPLIDAQEPLAEASIAMKSAQARADAIDTSATLPVLTDAVVQLQDAATSAAGALDAADRAARLVPPMLGAGGPRDYLLLFSNLAELRATGGIAGAVALVHTEGGRIDLAQQAEASDFGPYPVPVVELPAETQNLYGARTGAFLQSANLTPRFSLSAEIAREMWNREFGLQPDGVIAIDPVVLSYLLEATGPITLPTGDVLTADNAVQLLLVDVYARYTDTNIQDLFFASAAASVFDAVAGGNFDAAALIRAMALAGEENRVLVWNADVAEQEILAGTNLRGDLPVSDADQQQFGVYFNDGTGAKMDSYLDAQVAVGQSTCRDDGRPLFRVNVTVTNTAPADAAASLTPYVTGGRAFGVVPGNIKTQVSVYGTAGLENQGVALNGSDTGYFPAVDGEYGVSQVVNELAPGQTAVYSFDWLGAEPFDGELGAWVTPMIDTVEVGEIVLACDEQ